MIKKENIKYNFRGRFLSYTEEKYGDKYFCLLDKNFEQDEEKVKVLFAEALEEYIDDTDADNVTLMENYIEERGFSVSIQLQLGL